MKEDITTDPTGIKKIIQECYEELNTKKLDLFR